MTRRHARALMLQGTGSHAGKTVLVAGFCRLLARRGLRVLPFKSQKHGLLDSGAARCRILDWAWGARVAHRAGAAPDARVLREAAYDRLADTLDAVLDHARLRDLLAR